MDAFIDGYVDKSGHYEVFTDSDTYFSGKHCSEFSVNLKDDDRLICFDARKIYSVGLSKDTDVYDLRLIYRHDGDLSSLVRKVDIPNRDYFLELERRFTAHTRSVSEARMDVEKLSIRELVPDDVRTSYMKARILVMRQLFGRLQERDIFYYESRIFGVFKNILEIEAAKIKIDVPYVESQLKRNDLAVHEIHFFKSLRDTVKDGFVKTRISPVGSKTSRLRVESGFNCMAIPHGAARKAVTSRFEGGSIVTIDFNAIDFRCIVDAVNDKQLNEIYKGQRDYHSVVTKLLGDFTPELRATAKDLTYVHVYGSSFETLQKSTGLDSATLRQMLEKVSKLFEPISKFKKEIAAKGRAQGFLITPGGYRVEIDPKDHDGKIIGLYAQTYSSAVFNKALYSVLAMLRVCRLENETLSKVIFTVHDEIAFDMHPEEMRFTQLLADTMEATTGYAVKKKEGKNYYEATDS